MTFQIILYPDGRIVTQYNEAESSGTMAGSPPIQLDTIIGIQNAGGTQGIGYRVNGVGGPMFGSNLALVMAPVGTPLGVMLADFQAEQVGDYVLVTWETVSELNNAGFNLYRGLLANGGDRELLTFVPSQSPGSSQGASYTYSDTAVEAGQTYWYWLEDVDLTGRTTLHGPVSITLSVPTAVTLSGLSTDAAAGTSFGWPLAILAAALAIGFVTRRRQITP